MRVTVILPALNEGASIADLVKEFQAQDVAQIIVVDNGSTDDTAKVAKEAGARVVPEVRQGYGYACAAGVHAATDTDVLVFMDADGSFLPQELPALLRPIAEQEAQLVLGSRVLGQISAGAMPPQQRFGNALTSMLVRRLYGVPITDLGPYRAIQRTLLNQLNLQEMTYGYPTEMIVKAARSYARIVEVPVTFLPRRAGVSKVSGTVRGTMLAGYRILSVVLRYGWERV